jgi:hypothetical protein
MDRIISVKGPGETGGFDLGEEQLVTMFDDASEEQFNWKNEISQRPHCLKPRNSPGSLSLASLTIPVPMVVAVIDNLLVRPLAPPSRIR